MSHRRSVVHARLVCETCCRSLRVTLEVEGSTDLSTVLYAVCNRCDARLEVYDAREQLDADKQAQTTQAAEGQASS